MDHDWIEEHSVAESYVLGRLPPAEAVRFEEHLLACPGCRERVTWAEELRGSLQSMAAEDRRRVARLGLLAWLARRGRTARMGFAAALLLAAALPAALLVEEVRLRHQLAEAHATSAPRPGPARQASLPAAAPATTGAGAPPAWAAERNRLTAQLRQRDEMLRAEQRQQGELRGRLADLTRPQINTTILTLGLVRGAEQTNRLLLGARPVWIVLAIELPAPGSGTYRATLIDQRGRTVWSGEGLRPTASDTLVVSLHSSLLAAGDYRLVIRGAGTPAQGSEISFQVVAPG